MELSARNRLQGTVSEISLGQVMASVKLTLGDGQIVTAAITREAVEQLGLEVGSPAVAVIKATEVILGTE
jgi:molybdate transport system regulatory protein